ncbi:MAG: tRNA uridine-5-carboxymethylaminomethyl(34) synthesis GTPase MnmE [Deltaproteobacteria bacterium]
MIDTIAAISTALGEGGIGIIRISGPKALDCGMRVFVFSSGVDKENIKERYLYYGRVCRDNKTIDNGFFVYMAAPATYTGADVVELHCHGGPLVLKNILSEVLRSGARPAMPGEFTKQAFLNGKLDLAQAEAVIDVIRAETDLALSSARSHLDGVFSKRVNKIKDALFGALTLMQAHLDFPEEELGPTPDTLTILASASREIKTVLDTYEEGAALKNGVRVIIAGRPNVGKSSLLNILLKEERAIVTPHPGTTRDVLEETINLRGAPIRLMDTAGLTHTDDPVEAIGIERARERIKEAHLVLYVVDSSAAIDEDIEIIKELEGKKILIVANKADLLNEKRQDELKAVFQGRRICLTSALRSTGIEELKDAIFEAVSGRAVQESADAATSGLVVSLRHKQSLEKALESIERAIEAATGNEPLELCAADTRIALTSLGEITGEVTTEDILDRIFSEFCIGK